MLRVFFFFLNGPCLRTFWDFVFLGLSKSKHAKLMILWYLCRRLHRGLAIGQVIFHGKDRGKEDPRLATSMGLLCLCRFYRNRRGGMSAADLRMPRRVPLAKLVVDHALYPGHLRGLRSPRIWKAMHSFGLKSSHPFRISTFYSTSCWHTGRCRYLCLRQG